MTVSGEPVPAARPSNRRRASVSTFLGTFGNIVVVAAQSVVLTPVYVRRIGDHLFGAWLGSGDFLAWMQAFDLGLPNLMTQRVGAADARQDTAELGRWLANGMLALGLVAAVIAAAGATIAGRLPGVFGVTGLEGAQLSRAFLVGAIATAGTVLNNGIVGYSRGVQRTGLVNASMVVGSIAGFATALLLVFGGFKLMAIAWGMAARSIVVIAGSGAFLASELTAEVRSALKVDGRSLRECARVLPATAIGGLSYAAMNQSELAVLALVLSPEKAAVFMVTRRAAELVRAVADTVAFSSYGAFAHLVTSGERARSSQIYSEIIALRTSLAVALSAAFIAANPGFVSIWVGRDHFAGLLVSALIGLQSIVIGGAYLTNYLFRATGGVVQGSLALAVEAVLRVALAVTLVRSIGTAGIPLATIATGLLFGYMAHRWTLKAIQPFTEPAASTTLVVWMVRIGLLVCACAVSWIAVPPGWAAPVIIGGSFALLGLTLLFAVDRRAMVMARSAGVSLAAIARTP